MPHRDVETAVETRLATWGELDFDGLVWTISPKLMRAKRKHRVPLSPGLEAAAVPFGTEVCGGVQGFPSTMVTATDCRG